MQPPVAPPPRVDDSSELGSSADVSESCFDALDRQGREQKHQQKQHRVDLLYIVHVRSSAGRLFKIHGVDGKAIKV